MSENKNLKRAIIAIIIFIIVVCFILAALNFKTIFFLSNRDETNNNILASMDWHEEYMQYDLLHNYSTGKTQVIALIDSGISDFQLSEINKSCSLVQDISEYDTNGHGTMMCSLILGYECIEGIAPDVKLNSYKVVGSSGRIEPEILSEAINMAVQDEVTVINVSMGSYFDNELVKNSIMEALDLGITVVASSGDYETEDMLYPARYSECISVGAIDKDLNLWDGTNAPEQCVILAPGAEIKTVDADKKLLTHQESLRQPH